MTHIKVHTDGVTRFHFLKNALALWISSAVKGFDSYGRKSLISTGKIKPNKWEYLKQIWYADSFGKGNYGHSGVNTFLGIPSGVGMPE